jgi:hypothetical protein
MVDFLVAPAQDGPYVPPMENRVARLEDDMRDVKSTLSRLEPLIIRIDATLTSTLPHLATRAELANLRSEMNEKFGDVPTKTYLWGLIGVLITAYAAGLAALAVLK